MTFEMTLDETGDASRLKEVTDAAMKEGEKILETIPSMDDTDRAIQDGVAMVQTFDSPNGMKACPWNGRICGGWCALFDEQKMCCSIKSLAIIVNLMNYGGGR